MVRLEDLLWQPDRIVREIQYCLGLDEAPQSLVHVVGAAKWHHSHHKRQSNRITALIHSRGLARLRNMTRDDYDMAQSTFRDLQKAFHYAVPTFAND